MLISTSELNSILNDPDIIIADTRSFKEYSEDHIPGSVHLDLFAFHWIDTTKQGIENFNSQARTLLSFLGVTSEKKVIFYDSVSGMLAARGVWMLMYFSHQNVSMLDGGITKWKKENLSLEIKANNFKPSKFLGKINPDIISGFEHIRDNLDKKRKNSPLIQSKNAVIVQTDKLKSIKGMLDKMSKIIEEKIKEKYGS